MSGRFGENGRERQVGEMMKCGKDDWNEATDGDSGSGILKVDGDGGQMPGRAGAFPLPLGNPALVGGSLRQAVAVFPTPRPPASPQPTYPDISDPCLSPSQPSPSPSNSLAPPTRIVIELDSLDT